MQQATVMPTGTGVVGTHTAYETDGNGNEIEVTYDAGGKIISSRKTGRKTSSNSGINGTETTDENWSKMVSALKSKIGGSYGTYNDPNKKIGYLDVNKRGPYSRYNVGSRWDGSRFAV